jgi:hypothetical protein
MAVDATITLSASSVLPRPLGTKIDENQSTVTVEVTPKLRMNGEAWDVTMQVIEGAGGGHDEGHTGTRPTGGITIEGGAVPDAGTCLSLPQPTAASTSVTTDGAGKAEFTYTACEVSGIETLQASVTLTSGPTPFPKTTTITVEAEDGADFDLSGGTTQHKTGSNHYGTRASRDRMREIANTYAALLAELGGGELGVNDMSLEKGGLFDVSGKWRTPHSEHRDGKDADIDRKHAVGSGFVKQVELRNIVRNKQALSLLLEKEKGGTECQWDVANQPVPNTPDPDDRQLCRMHIHLE